MDEEEEILWRLTGLAEFLCTEYDKGLDTPESIPQVSEYDVGLGGLGTPESVPQVTEYDVGLGGLDTPESVLQVRKYDVGLGGLDTPESITQVPEYDVGLGGLDTPESAPPEYDVGLDTPESMPLETDHGGGPQVTEVVVTGTTSGGVVRVQRGWSEESGYRSEGEAGLTELGVVSEAAQGGDTQEDADDEDEMVLVPSGKRYITELLTQVLADLCKLRECKHIPQHCVP